MGQLALIFSLAFAISPPTSAPSESVAIAPVEPATNVLAEPPASEPAPATIVEQAEPAPIIAPEAPDEHKKKKKKKEKKYSFDVGARIVAGARLRYIEPGLNSDGERIGQPERKGSLQLRQARVKVKARYLDVLSAKVSLEFADLLDQPKPGKVLRDAWGNVKIHPAFQIKVGHFKRPYSRIELRGVSSLPVIGRGLYNKVAVEDLAWGDRAVGVAVWGKIKPERPGLHALGYSVTASNNAVSGSPNGVDVHARMTYNPVKWLSIGAGGAYKHVQDALADEASCLAAWRRDPSCRRDVFGADFDLVFKVKGLYASVEANMAQDWLYADTSPWMVGALGYATYDFKVGDKTRIQPLVLGEFVDTNLSYSESEAVRTVAGLNVLWTKHLRVLPQVQYVLPLAPVTAFNHFVESWVVGVWVSVQL